MLNDAVQTALNEQINLELSSAYVYLAMAAFFEAEGYGGCGKWMHHQAEEEVEHAMRLFAYVNDRGGRVVLQAIPSPEKEFGTLLDAFKTALGHEQRVTASIHKLLGLAREHSDYATETHLHWFVDEQVEEEKTASEIIDMLAMAGEARGALFMIDRQLGERSQAGH